MRRARQGLLAGTVALSVSVAAALAQQTVTGSGVDRALAWRLERRWSVGGSDDTELLLSLMGAKDLAVDARGRLLVVDRAENRVAVFDATGKPEGALGRKGLGPGELTFPLAIAANDAGETHVYDGAKNAVVVFGPSGQTLPEYPLKPRLTSWNFEDDGAVVGLSNRPDSVRLLRVSKAGPSTLVAIAQPKVHSIPNVCDLTDWPAPPIFAPSIAWATRGGRTVASTGAFRVSVFDHGHLVRVLSRDARRRRATAALARQQVGRGADMQIQGRPRCTIPPEKILQTAEVADELPAYDAMVIAPDERIWAVRYAVRGEPGSVDIYHPVRGYEGSMSLGKVRPVAFLGPDVLVSLERDADDVPVIVAYAVRQR